MLHPWALWLWPWLVLSVAADAVTSNHNSSVVLEPEEMRLRLGFPTSPAYSVQVSRKLDKNEREIFAKLTRVFLRLKGITLVELNLGEQHWRSYQQIKREEKDASKNSQDSLTTVLVQDEQYAADRMIAFLNPDTQIWTMTMNIVAYNTNDIPSVVREDGRSYLDILEVGLDHVFLPFEASSSEKNDFNRTLAWMLSGLTLSLAILLAVMIVRFSGRRPRSNSNNNTQNQKTKKQNAGIPTNSLWWHRQWRHQRMGDDHHNVNAIKERDYDLEESSILSSIIPESYFIDDTPSRAPQGMGVGDLALEGSTSGATSGSSEKGGVITTLSLESNSIVPDSSPGRDLVDIDLNDDESCATESGRGEHAFKKSSSDATNEKVSKKASSWNEAAHVHGTLVFL